MKAFFSRKHDSQTGQSKSASKDPFKLWINHSDKKNATKPVQADATRPQATSNRAPKPTSSFDKPVPAPPTGAPTETTIYPTTRTNTVPQPTYPHPSSSQLPPKATTRPQDYDDVRYHPPPRAATSTGFFTTTSQTREERTKSSRGYLRNEAATITRREVWAPATTQATSKPAGNTEEKYHEKIFTEELENYRGQTEKELKQAKREDRQKFKSTRDREDRGFISEREVDRDHRYRNREKERKESEAERMKELEGEKERIKAREKEREREIEREKARERERRLKAERERQKEIEREKEQREQERQKEIERERERERQEMEREKERQRERERLRQENERERERERQEMEREKERQRERERLRQEIENEKERERERQKEVEREKERQRERARLEIERERERQRELEREKERERERQKEIEREKERQRERERERARQEIEREKERQRGRELEREREQERENERERERQARERREYRDKIRAERRDQVEDYDRLHREHDSQRDKEQERELKVSPDFKTAHEANPVQQDNAKEGPARVRVVNDVDYRRDRTVRDRYQTREQYPEHRNRGEATDSEQETFRHRTSDQRRSGRTSDNYGTHERRSSRPLRQEPTPPMGDEDTSSSDDFVILDPPPRQDQLADANLATHPKVCKNTMSFTLLLLILCLAVPNASTSSVGRRESHDGELNPDSTQSYYLGYTASLCHPSDGNSPTSFERKGGRTSTTSDIQYNKHRCCTGCTKRDCEVISAVSAYSNFISLTESDKARQSRRSGFCTAIFGTFKASRGLNRLISSNGAFLNFLSIATSSPPFPCFCHSTSSAEDYLCIRTGMRFFAIILISIC